MASILKYKLEMLVKNRSECEKLWFIFTEEILIIIRRVLRGIYEH